MFNQKSVSKVLSFVVASGLLALALLNPGAARAEGTVTSCDFASLEAALSGGGLVTMDCSGTVTFPQAIAISGAVPTTIDATGHTVVFAPGGTNRFFTIAAGSQLTLTAITLQNGRSNADGGGAILNSGSLTINTCTFSGNNDATGNTAGGGAIMNKGTLEVNDSTFTTNSTSGAGRGGAIHNVPGATMHINRSTFKGNNAPGAQGGAIFNQSVNANTITNSTFSSNTALGTGGWGGAIYNYAGGLTITNSTIAANSANTNGGGGLVSRVTALILQNSIINNNIGGNCIANNGGTIAPSTGSGNLSYPADNCPVDSSANPSLIGLGSYGGPTQTYAFTSASSPAHNLASSCPPTDQRGVARSSPGCDSGAYEMRHLGLATSGSPSTDGDPVTFSASLDPAAAGTVQWFDNGEPLGSTALDAGEAALTTSSLAVGTHAITATFTSASSSETVNAALAGGQTVNDDTIAITVTADAQSKVYGQADPGLIFTYTPELEEGDSFTGSLSREAGEDVGEYAILQGSLTAGPKYAITFVGAALEITPRAMTITADPKSKVYGDPDPGLTFTASPPLVSGDGFTGGLTRASGKNVGAYDILQGTLTPGGNYDVTYVGAQLSITPKPVTITAEAKTKTYGQADPPLTASASPPLVSGDSLTGSLGREPGEAAGQYDILRNTLTPSPNYTVTYTGASLTIAPLAVAVTANPRAKVYGQPDPLLTYAHTPELVNGDVFTGALSRQAGEGVGNYSITRGSLALSGNYTLSFTGSTLSITARGVDVTAAARSKVYGQEDPELTYNFEPPLLGSDLFTGALARAPGEDAGQYDITQGTLSAGANYAITFHAAKLTIQPKPITVTAAAKSKVYGDPDPELTYSVNPALESGDLLTGSLVRTPGENVNSYSILKGSLSGGGNYSITFAGAQLTVTAKSIAVTAQDKTKQYSDPDPALTYSCVPPLVGDDSFIGFLSRAAGENVGDYAINRGSLDPGANYAMTFAGATLSIDPKPINVTAETKTKTYGNLDPELTFTHSPELKAGDDFTGGLARVGGKNVGQYDILQGSLALSANYTLVYHSAKLTITARPITVTAAAKSKVYGQVDPPLTYAYAPDLVSGDSFTGSLSRASGAGAGQYDILIGTLTPGTNYSVTFNSAKLTIQPKPITVTAAAKSKVYGDADPSLTYTASPELESGDSFSGGLERAAGENVGAYNINQGTLTPGLNYDVNYEGAQLTITARPVAVTAAAASKTYGDPDPALGYNASPALVSGDSFTGSLARQPGEAAGQYDLLIGTLTPGSNYSLTFNSAKLTITAKHITVTAAAKNKVYGQPDPLLTFTHTPALVGSDSFTGSLARAAGEAAGQYDILQGSLALNANYTLSYASAKLIISPLPITVTAGAKSKTYGDPDPTLTFTNAPALVGSDSFTGSLSRAPGANAGQYDILIGSLTPGTNYSVTFVSAKLTIFQKFIDVVANPLTKVYGTADPNFTYSFSPSLVAGDSFSGSLARAAGENVGEYEIEQGSLALSSNYIITYTGDTLVITKAPLTVRAEDKVRRYKEENPALTYTISGFALTDTQASAVTGSPLLSTTATKDSPGGEYAITIRAGSLAASNYTFNFVSGKLTIVTHFTLLPIVRK